MKKLIVIIHNSALKSNVLEVLEKNGVKKYTQLDDVKGKGSSSEPHLGTHVWPGINSITFSAVDSEVCHELVKGFRVLKEKFKSEGIKVFVLPVEEEV